MTVSSLARMSDEGWNRLKDCRHGRMLYNVNDRYIGRSLDLYGEFSEAEVELFRQIVRPGDIVVEVGANDALRGLSPDAARANLEQVIVSVKAKQPRARIALIQMEAPPNYGVAYTRSFHSVYVDVAKKEGIPLLPFLLDGVAGISRLNQPDGLPSTRLGNRLLIHVPTAREWLIGRMRRPNPRRREREAARGAATPA